MACTFLLGLPWSQKQYNCPSRSQMIDLSGKQEGKLIPEEGKVQLFLEFFTLEKNDDTAEKVRRKEKETIPAHRWKKRQKKKFGGVGERNKWRESLRKGFLRLINSCTRDYAIINAICECTKWERRSSKNCPWLSLIRIREKKWKCVRDAWIYDVACFVLQIFWAECVTIITRGRKSEEQRVSSEFSYSKCTIRVAARFVFSWNHLFILIYLLPHPSLAFRESVMNTSLEIASRGPVPQDPRQWWRASFDLTFYTLFLFSPSLLRLSALI